MQGDFTCLGLQLPAVAARPSIYPSRVALVSFGTAKLVGLLVQLLVQYLLPGRLHKPIQMVPDLALIDSDHVPNIARLAALAYACHRGLRLVLMFLRYMLFYILLFTY